MSSNLHPASDFSKKLRSSWIEVSPPSVWESSAHSQVIDTVRKTSSRHYLIKMKKPHSRASPGDLFGKEGPLMHPGHPLHHLHSNPHLSEARQHVLTTNRAKHLRECCSIGLLLKHNNPQVASVLLCKQFCIQHVCSWTSVVRNKTALWYMKGQSRSPREHRAEMSIHGMPGEQVCNVHHYLSPDLMSGCHTSSSVLSKPSPLPCQPVRFSFLRLYANWRGKEEHYTCSIFFMQHFFFKTAPQASSPTAMTLPFPGHTYTSDTNFRRNTSLYLTAARSLQSIQTLLFETKPHCDTSFPLPLIFVALLSRKENSD